MIDAELLAADQALDQAWRGGVGVAMAVTRAQELSDPLRLDVLLEDAKANVSDRQRRLEDPSRTAPSSTELSRKRGR